ncbi:MAG: accessory gene regulator B family protein [Clostridium sp.]
MMKNKIYEILLKNGVGYEYDLISYGFALIMRYILFFLILMIISMLFNLVLEVFMLSVVFNILRKYAGGFHFNDSYICYLFSFFSIILFSFFISISDFHINQIIIIDIIYLFTVILLSPQDCKNKRLTKSEKKYYSKVSLYITLILSFFSILFYSLYSLISRTIVIAFVFMTLNLLIAYCINKHTID